MLDSRAVGQVRPEAESPSEKAHECMVSQEGLSVRGRFKRQPHVKLCAIRTRAEVDFSVMPLTTILWLITRPSPVPELPLVVKKGTVKMCGRTSGGIPLPLSAISARKNSPSRRVHTSIRPVQPTA